MVPSSLFISLYKTAAIISPPEDPVKNTAPPDIGLSDTHNKSTISLFPMPSSVRSTGDLFSLIEEGLYGTKGVQHLITTTLS